MSDHSSSNGTANQKLEIIMNQNNFVTINNGQALLRLLLYAKKQVPKSKNWRLNMSTTHSNGVKQDPAHSNKCIEICEK